MLSVPTDLILLPIWPSGGGGGGRKPARGQSVPILNHLPATAELKRGKCFLFPNVIGHDD